VTVTVSVVAGAFLLALLLEWRFPLRKEREPKARRVGRNLALAALSALVGLLLQIPLLTPLSQWAAEHHLGLLNLVALPAWASVVLGVLLLDYTLWWWHKLSHRVAFLWRFHLVHHVDRDLDASTALRFHFGEHTLSVLYRVLQIVVLGASPFAIWLWQLVLFASILFHHANIDLPMRWERVLVRFVVTPRMHGIHHSERFRETDSNWSSILTWWDRLHGTLVLDVPQESITIGIPAYQDPRDVTLGRILAMPFRRQRRAWPVRE
jgi:sterol desaturase/sphingolipid hydroxylase (fatty acid hydroxylase superfamily)